jgi:hypothetical protein
MQTQRQAASQSLGERCDCRESNANDTGTEEAADATGGEAVSHGDDGELKKGEYIGKK